MGLSWVFLQFICNCQVNLLKYLLKLMKQILVGSLEGRFYRETP